MANSLVGFSPCHPLYFTQPRRLSLFSVLIHSALRPVANIVFNTQTHRPARKKSPSHKGHSSHYIYCSDVKIHSRRHTFFTHTHICLSYTRCHSQHSFIYIRHTSVTLANVKCCGEHAGVCHTPAIRCSLPACFITPDDVQPI